jgi:hypothetical protein
MWGVLAVLGIAVLIWTTSRARQRRSLRDHGSVSESWLAEHRGKGPGDDRS